MNIALEVADSPCKHFSENSYLPLGRTNASGCEFQGYLKLKALISLNLTDQNADTKTLNYETDVK